MKISCDRENLFAAFQTAASVVPTRSPKPILQNVKFEVSAQGPVLMATDTEIGIRVEVSGVEVQSEGAAILPVSRFAAILRESSDEKLSIESDDQGTTIRGQRSEFRLPGENPEEFPVVGSFVEEQYHEVSARLLKELVKRTIFATDAESSRYALGGVLLEMEQDKIIAVGTDGRRLAKMEAPAASIGGHTTGDNTTIVPARAMQLIERALSDADAEIQIAARGNDVLVKTPQATIYSRLVEGRFPRWRDVFPNQTGASQIEIAAGPLYSALRQAAIAASDESRGINFKFGEGSLELTSSTPQVGQSRVEMPIGYDGADITISLDNRFVGEFLKVLDPQKIVTVSVTDGDSAAVCSTDDGYGYVIMPLTKDR